MNTKNIQIRKNLFSFVSLSIAASAVFIGLFISLLPVHREYFSAGISAKDADNDAGAKGEQDFFFNARKNINTNSMDYASMLAADIAARAMNTGHKTHAVSAVPNFTWQSMGPNNIGGRTRAILIDNTDPTHQTLFAGAITGGIWKSTNGGGTWDNAANAISYSLNDNLSNMNICCIAQDANGAIYAGTGEGFTAGESSEFSSAELGGGVFKSTDGGKTWRLLPSTIPTNLNSSTIAWSYTNRLAVRPDVPTTIYAATNFGVFISRDSGTTWQSAVTPTNTKLTGASFNSLDLKISTDGSVIVACIGGNGYYCYPKTSDGVFTKIKNTGVGRLTGSASRIEFAISPTDPKRIYASEINGNRVFYGVSGATSGIFMTKTADSSGGYWYEIGPGGTSFDPYAEPGAPITDDQPTYDNTLGVPPANEAQVLIGGTTMWEWSGANNSDTIGSWLSLGAYSAIIHPDLHAIVFDQNHPQTVYVGCDGGIYRCTNFSITPTNAAQDIRQLMFESINRNYNVTQYYSVCCSPQVTYVNVPVSINNGTSTATQIRGMGCGGGTQDNGSPYMNGTAFINYPNDAADLSGGDGAGSVVSTLNPNIAYFCSDLGALEREGNLGALSFPTTAYTQTSGVLIGGDIDSSHRLGGSCFVFPVALYENSNDLMNLDSLQFVADETYTIGQVIWPISPTGGIPYPYTLPVNLPKGDTLRIPDRVVSRLAVGFTGQFGGVWITGQAASNNTVVWMPIGGPLSKPTGFGDNSPIHAIAWTADGNTLFVGTEDGTIFRFSNINSIIANKYASGALWYDYASGIHPTGNTNIVSTQITIAGISGRDVLSISTDPNNINNVIVTAGNYGQSIFIYHSSNATSATPTFIASQGNLPAMPVYSSILDLLDSSGHYITNSAMVGTEHGIYTTSDITKGNSTQWVKSTGGGMANVMTLALKQQTAPTWLSNNSGVIYAGTHGRGIWSANNSYNITTAVAPVTASAPALDKLLIYPNPMTAQGNIEYTLGSDDNVTVTIYDMQGKEVKIINLGTQSEGSHLVTFESAGLRGGTYFASLTGSNFRKVSKFVVVK